MKYYLALILLFNLSVHAQQPFAIVELFTSEGCSSCPAADNLLGEIKTNAEKSGQNIITLAYHVDYWNKLGWKDPYSKYQYTIRQENYSRVLADKELFTPQAVINGKLSCTGSRKEELLGKITTELKTSSGIFLEIKKDSLRNDTLFLSYKLQKENPDYVLRLALTEDGLSGKVSTGENSGKTLFHESVVRSLFSVNIPLQKGQTKIFSNVFTGKGKRHLIAFLQLKKDMRIVAAQKVDLLVE